jgi:hypothetical protein
MQSLSIFGRKPIELGQYTGVTYPVSEARAEMLSEIVTDIAKEFAKYDNFTDIPRKVLGRLRRKKAEALIEFDSIVPDEFYESKDYPVSVVEDALIFFTMYVGKG